MAVNICVFIARVLGTGANSLFLTEPHHGHGHHLHKVMETWKK
jgi:hypothetical protein